MKSWTEDDIVLVGVLKSRRDLDLVLQERWYRIPCAWMPKRRFSYLAFYEPVRFGKMGKPSTTFHGKEVLGKCIRYYAKVLGRRVALRRELLPEEVRHARAGEQYVRFQLDAVQKLPQPIKNVVPRRVSFGFTTLRILQNVRTMLELYDVLSTEEVVERGLRRRKVRFAKQYHVKGKKKRVILDFAVFCKKGNIAIECDNLKAHSGVLARRKDRAKDAFLRRCGWRVIRLRERDVLADLDACIARVEKVIGEFGGVVGR